MKYIVFVAIALSLLPKLSAETFLVKGSEIWERKVIVSYDPKISPIDDIKVQLSYGEGKTLDLPDFEPDWSWNTKHPEETIYSVTWTEDGKYFYIVYQAGRILTGFDVYHFTGDSLSKVDVDSTVQTLYQKAIIGQGPLSPNNSGCHIISWLSMRTFLVDLQTADDIFYATLFITKDGKTRLTNLFSLSEPLGDDE